MTAVLDFEVKRCSRRCAATDSELTPGEAYFSVLAAEGAEVVRRDYSASAWQGPPDDAIGWWESRMPTADGAKPKLAPREVALELFDRWADTTEMADAVYVLALFLIRKRVFRFAESALEFDQEPAQVLRCFCPARASEYDVHVVDVSTERAAKIQNQLVELLYCDAA